jgi:hypothetical protein
MGVTRGVIGENARKQQTIIAKEKFRKPWNLP